MALINYLVREKEHKVRKQKREIDVFLVKALNNKVKWKHRKTKGFMLCTINSVSHLRRDKKWTI